jgi:transposase-like protein
MPKGTPDKKYTGEFKQQVVETMRDKRLGYNETAKLFGIRHKRVQDWERIYLEEGPEGLYVDRRGRTTGDTRKGRPPKLGKKVEEDLIAEVQRLRAENDYLKKLNALVSERVQREKKHKS